VSGTVVDSSGKPMPQTFVLALIGSRQVGQGMTDQDGRFAFGVPPGATVDLEAQPSLGKSRPPDVGERRGVIAGSTDVTITVAAVEMDRALEIALDLPEGATAGKCEVAANFHGFDSRDYAKYKATFDAAGRARIEGLPHGPVTLRVQVRLAGDDDKTYTGLTPLRVAADATSARVVVPGFRNVRGRVIDESGTPSPGAYLFSTAAFFASQVYADAQGRFALRVPSDAPTPFLVIVTKTPFDRKAPCGGWDLVEDGSDRELEIVVKPQPPR